MIISSVHCTQTVETSRFSQKKHYSPCCIQSKNNATTVLNMLKNTFCQIPESHQFEKSVSFPKYVSTAKFSGVITSSLWASSR